ncbi:MAG: hypothetical protein KatS3mg102_0616 [Planctomycetota bacterium]|nr:MAG: hypothetical protein KatS3mg102_0616 [Planctomycetota bacterium]
MPMVSHCLVSPVFSPSVRILRRGRSYTLGRDPGSDFPLPSEHVSRRHAIVQWVREGEGGQRGEGRFAIRDLGSRNGTRVNGALITEHLLADGDSIWIGPFQLKYRVYTGDIGNLLEEAQSDFSITTDLPRATLEQTPRRGSLGGRFAGGELLEICQLIGLNEKDGVLHVQAGAEQGLLAFRRGQLIRARCGELRGEEAALRLLALTDGYFEFLAGPAGEQECVLAVEGLLMEAARRRDESGGPDLRQAGARPAG